MAMASFLRKLTGDNSKEISSHKWITTETTPTGRVLVAHKVDQVYKTLGASPCNLISIFGRARQGKSFLMNCLAGEEQIFKISNEKESCTQGIDISEKWMSVNDFSKVYGGASCEGKTKVGFVDAEGQGDRDVSYDANLVCPILLASKCVIFNWKGDLQKDHIMSTLGIMTRAAKNVTLSEGELAAGKKTFGHLHIVFRDWQAVDSDTDAVYKHLFGLEKSAEGAVRDQIRKDVLNNFESVRVWLFDPPSDSTAVLKTKLSISKCSTLFKSQLLSLRKVLSNQLVPPTLFGGQIMTAKSLTSLVTLVVGALNKGETILPQSTYISMVKSEVHQIREKLGQNMDKICDSVLGSIPVGTDFKSEKVAMKDFDAQIDDLVRAYLKEVGETVGSLKGDMWNSVMSDSPAFVTGLKSSVTDLFVSKYKGLYAVWLRNATSQAQDTYSEKLDDLKNLKWAIGATELPKKLDSLYDEAYHFLQVDKHGKGAEMKDSIEKLNNFIELKNIKFRETNTRKMEDGEKEVKEMVQKSIIQMKHEVDQEVLSLVKCKGGKSRGYSRHGLETRLNDEYFSLDAKMRKFLQGSPYELAVAKEFKEACVVLHNALCSEYETAIDDAFSKTVAISCAQIKQDFLSVSPTIASSNSWKIRLDNIYKNAEESVSEWTLCPSDREILLEPIRTLGGELTQELMGRVREAVEIKTRHENEKREKERRVKEEKDRRIKEENERRMREEQERRAQKEEQDRWVKEENERRVREEEERKEREEDERRVSSENERRRRDEEETERIRQEELSVASQLLEQEALAERLREEEKENGRMQIEEDDEDDVEAESPPKGGLGVRKAAIAQKERAAKWAKDNLGEKGISGGVKLVTGKALSALEIAKEDAKKIQKEKLDARVLKLKPKK